MNNNNKKYGMGGAVQSFSSPMLAQGMQGSLSGFGTSGIGTFAKGGEVEEFKIGDVVTHKKGKQYGHGKIYKLSSIGFYLEDEYGNKSEKHQIIPNDFKKVKKLADGGQMSEIERILAKYKAMESNKPKEDETSEFLRKSWEGKNIDDYIMYSDKYKRGGKMAKGGIMEHGLEEGDKIVKEIDNKWLIVKSKEGVHSVIDVEKGSRFIIGLDDSKMSGERTSEEAGFEQAMSYINYLKSTKMANGGTLDDAKIYVADLAEYNNGRLVGKWLDLSDYSSGAEVMEAIQEMLDEQTKKDKYGDVHEEYAIHDYEGFPRSFYSESMGESDFDALYESMRIADSSNLPLEVLLEAVSDLGYEDEPEKVAEAYYSSVPASMGNEWRDFAYDYIDSIGNITEAVSKPEYYFDFESFGSDIRMDYTDEELEEMGYNDLSDEELGEQMADEMGGVKYLGEELIERYFDYDKFGRELEYDFISVRGKDGNYYFFNRNFAKGGQFKMGGDVKKHTWIAIYQKGNERKILEVDASSREEAKLEAEEDKKRYKIPQEMFLYDIYRKFAEGGEIAQGNYEMMLSQAKEVQHHTTELQSVLKKEKNIDAWVVAKMENVSSTLSDITHYLDGKTEYAKGGKVESFLQKAKQGLKKGYKKSKEYTQKKIHDTKKKIALEVLDSTKGKVPNSEKTELRKAQSIVQKKYADGGELISEIKKKYVTAGNDSEGVWTYSRTTADEIAKKYNGEVQEDGSKLYVSLKKFAKGGKIGFEGLAKKVAKRYVRKKVSKQYQAEYGKTYDAKEAKEVGNKVAGKVYQQQVAKKKIVRKLQRKTN